jgi:peptidoglycan/LPS O-acetylase OafA/YrhL
MISDPPTPPEDEAVKPDEPGLGHLAPLDGLRGIAILMVVCVHFGFAAEFPASSHHSAGVLVQRIMFAGWAGVDLFFVLSGFLITRILLATRGGPRYIRNFYGRRMLRIFPLYFGSVLAGLLLFHVLLPSQSHLLEEAWAHQVWLWTYSMNIALALGVAANFGIFNQFWSLAIEEQYYLVWPWVVRRTGHRTLAIICSSLIVCPLVLRCLWIAAGATWLSAYWFTLCRLDALAMGGLAAIVLDGRLVSEERLRAWLGPALAVSLTALAILFVAVDPFYPSNPVVLTVGHSLVGTVAVLALARAVITPGSAWATAFSHPVLRFWGKYSYGVYVMHWPLLKLVQPAYKRWIEHGVHIVDAVSFFVLGILASLALACISYHGFEVFFLRLKRYFAYARHGDRADGPEEEAAAVAIDKRSLRPSG